MQLTSPTLSGPADGESVAHRPDKKDDLIGHVLGWKPHWLAISPCLEHLPFLSWLVHTADPDLAIGLEIGQGAAYFALCQSLARSHGAQFYGIDLWTSQDAASGESVIATPKALADHNDENYADFSRLICSPPSEAAEFFDLGGVDFLLVEQPLSATVLTTIRTDWVPQMSRQGIVILAGTDSATDPEAVDMLSALKASYPCIDFPHGGGLLALLVGPVQPAPIAEIARLDADRRSTLDRQLQTVGEMVTFRVKLTQNRAQIQNLRKRVDKERDAKEAEVRRVKTVQDLLQTERGQSASLQKQQEELAGRIAELEAAATEQAALQQKAEAKGKEQASRIAESEAMATKLAADKKALSEKLAALQQEAEANGKEQASRIAELETAATEHAADRKALSEKFAALQQEAESRGEELRASADTVDALRHEAEGARAHQQELTARIAELEATASGLEAERNDVAGKLSWVQQELDARWQELRASADTVDALRHEAEGARAYQNGLTARIAELEATTYGLEAERNDIAGKLSWVQQEVDAKGQALHAAGETIDQLRQEAEAARVRQEELASRIGDLESEKREAFEKIAALDQVIADKDGALRESLQRGEALRGESAALASTLESVKADMVGQIDHRERALADEVAKLAMVTKQCDDLAKGLASAQASIAVMETQYASAKAQIAARDEERTRIAAERSEAVLAGKTLERAAAAAKADIAKLDDRLSASRGKIDDLQAEIARLVAERDAAVTERTVERNAARVRQDIAPQDVGQEEAADVREALAALQAEQVQTLNELRAAEQQLQAVQQARQELETALAGKVADVESGRIELSNVLERSVAREMALGKMADKLALTERQKLRLEEDVAGKISEIVALTNLCENLNAKTAKPSGKKTARAS